MQPINPTAQLLSTPSGVLRWAQSVFKTLNGGVALASVSKSDANNIPDVFGVDNGNGIMIRLGPAYSMKWSGSSAAINHGLQRYPIGFIICDTDANAVIWRSATSTESVITLTTSNNAVNCTIYIF
jgi:hypothetical protein